MLQVKRSHGLWILALALTLAAPAAAETGSGSGPATPESGFMLTSRAFLGSPVLARDGTSVGTVGELMIQADTGRVAFVAVDLATGRTVAVPWRDVDVTRRGKVRLAVSRTALVHAPAIDVSRPETILRGSLPLAARGISTITGRVERPLAEPVALGADGPALTGVVVATKDEPQVRILLAPAPYLLRSGLELRPGDRIRAEGVELVLNGKAALVAYDIRTGDRRFRLRRADGTPLWTETPAVARTAGSGKGSGS
jgi:hypothetical protein